MAGTLPLADPLEIFWQDFHTWQSLWNFSFLKVLFFNFVCISKAELSKTYCLLGMNQNLSWPSFLVCPWDPWLHKWTATLQCGQSRMEQGPVWFKSGRTDLPSLSNVETQRHGGHAFLLSYQTTYQFPVQLSYFAL